MIDFESLLDWSNTKVIDPAKIKRIIDQNLLTIPTKDSSQLSNGGPSEIPVPFE